MSDSPLVDRGHRLVDRSETRRSARSTSTGGESTSRVEARADAHGDLDADLGVRVYGEEDWTLPGMGESGPRCGEYYPDGVCSECGRIHHGTHQCGRRSCPDCWGTWAKDSAFRATVRLQAYRHTQPDGVERRLVHTVASPPEAPQTKREFYEAWSDAYDLAKEKGVEGGVAVPHGYRVTEETKEEFRNEDPDVGVWVWLRETYEDWRDGVEWAPHFHIIGVAPDVEPGDTDADDGWLFKNIRSLERYALTNESSYEDVFGAVRYLLSHSTFNKEEGKNVVRWFGSLSTASFGEEARPSEGVMDTIERYAEKATEWSVEEEGEGGGEEDEEDDVCGDECDGQVIDVFDVPDYLRRNDPGRRVRARMNVAYEWRTGKVEPPPGLKGPRTADQFEDAVEALLGQR